MLKKLQKFSLGKDNKVNEMMIAHFLRQYNIQDQEEKVRKFLTNHPKYYQEVMDAISHRKEPLIILRYLQLIQLKRGDLVKIASEKLEIDGNLAKVFAVHKVTIDVLIRNTATMKMDKCRLRLENFEPIILDEEPKVKMLSQRLSQLRDKISEPFELEILDLLEQRVTLTQSEEDWLTKMEQRYAIKEFQQFRKNMGYKAQERGLTEDKLNELLLVFSG